MYFKIKAEINTEKIFLIFKKKEGKKKKIYFFLNFEIV